MLAVEGDPVNDDRAGDGGEMENMKTFNFRVVDGDVWVAMFCHKADAVDFARVGESVEEIIPPTPVGELRDWSIPRSSVSGEEASSTEEVIGVW